MFRAYRPDSLRVLEDCFYEDYPQTKIERVAGQVVNDEIKTKTYLLSVFSDIREIYKYYAGMKPSGRVPSISTQLLYEMLLHCPNFIDNQVINYQEIEQTVIACNGGRKEINPLMPDKVLVRCTFLEALVRLCIVKYYRTNEVDLPHQAVMKGFEENLLPYFQTFKCHNWRKERLWHEEIDIVFKRLNEYTEQIYKKYSGRYPIPGSTKKFMSSEEFLLIFQHSGLFSQQDVSQSQTLSSGLGEEEEEEDEFGPKLTQKFVNACFNVSMMTNKKETKEDKHY